MIFALRAAGDQIFPGAPGVPVQHDGKRPVQQARTVGLLLCGRSGLPVEQVCQDQQVVLCRIQRHIVFPLSHTIPLSDRLRSHSDPFISRPVLHAGHEIGFGVQRFPVPPAQLDEGGSAVQQTAFSAESQLLGEGGFLQPAPPPVGKPLLFKPFHQPARGAAATEGLHPSGSVIADGKADACAEGHIGRTLSVHVELEFKLKRRRREHLTA